MELTFAKIGAAVMESAAECACRPLPTITPESTLADLEFDSLSMVELIIAMEDALGRELPDDVWIERWSGATTVEDVTRDVAEALGVTA